MIVSSVVQQLHAAERPRLHDPNSSLVAHQSNCPERMHGFLIHSAFPRNPYILGCRHSLVGYAYPVFITNTITASIVHYLIQSHAHPSLYCTYHHHPPCTVRRIPPRIINITVRIMLHTALYILSASRYRNTIVHVDLHSFIPPSASRKLSCESILFPASKKYKVIWVAWFSFETRQPCMSLSSFPRWLAIWRDAVILPVSVP